MLTARNSSPICALLLSLTLSLLAAPLCAATLNVPSQFATIQAAVNAAANGDTVLIADGTYTGPGNVDVDFGGINLTVMSASGDPTKAIIDCGGLVSNGVAGDYRGFYFHSGETNAVISGLTIENGYQSGTTANSDAGGGIKIAGGSTVTITNCNFTNNAADSQTNDIGNGGSVYNEGTLTLTNCNVSDSYAANKGGGIYNVGTMTMLNDNVYDNVVTHGSGCGLYNNTGKLTLDSCVLARNTGVTGGGFENLDGELTLTACAIVKNTVSFDGGGFYNDGSGMLTLTNCLVANNDADMGGNTGSGGAGDNNTNGTVTLTNCTVTGNIAPNDGGVDNDNGGMLILLNDILYGDTGSEVDLALNVTYSFCDIQHGVGGTSNINADPLFVNATNGDFHLKANSPCIGKGTPDGAPTTDIDGNTRPNPPGIGAYEGPAPPPPSTYLLWDNTNVHGFSVECHGQRVHLHAVRAVPRLESHCRF